MTRRLLIPFLLTICFFTQAFAQIPVPTKAINWNSNLGFGSAVCPPGVTAFAGTSNQILFPNAQSNDVEFLCFNDFLEIDHLGGQTFGDPIPATAPGISYAFFNCPPTVDGTDLATVLTDPCHITVPPPGPNTFYSVQSMIDIDGNATFSNTGALQTTFSGGNPTEVWFAPFTVDDFSIFNFEQQSAASPLGPCIHVNTTDAFRVVYLNEMLGSNQNTTASGACGGSFIAEGGLPEFDGSDYISISITLSTNPAITGTITSAPGTSHGETVQFTVPQPGVYEIVIEDGKSCSSLFTMDMSDCGAVTLETTAGDETANTGDLICVPVVANGFTDMVTFQYIINYDPTVLLFNLTPPSPTNINPVDVPPVLAFDDLAPGSITINWLDETFGGQTLADGSILYEICFTAIGASGTSSPISFSGDATTVIEASDINGVITTSFNMGSVTINSSSITLDFGICTTDDDDGNFTLTAGGGVAPYGVTWVQQGNPTNMGTAMIPVGIPNVLVDGLVFGTYDVIVTDATGAIQTSTVEILNLDGLSTQTTFINPDCPDGVDGSVSLVFSGGIAPYDILWSTGDMNVTAIAGLPQDDYSVTVTDNLGCSSSSSQSLIVQSITLDTVLLQHVSCTNGANSGALTVAAFGGAGGFTYLWDSGETTAAITGLAAGAYQVTATDVNGCSIISPFTINEPLSPSIMSWDSVSVACPSDLSGELTPNVTPGNSMIDTYMWNDPMSQTTATATSLSAGTYTVTVTDVDGCSVVDSASLFAPPPLSVMFNVTEPNCPGVNSGLISAIPTGGSSNYTYTWSNQSTESAIAALACDATYTVTISDGSNCGDIVDSVFLNCPTPIVVVFDTVNIVGVDCFNGVPCDGVVTAIASGGTAGTGLYDFVWSSGEMTSMASQSTAMQLCQGIQSVIVNDANCATPAPIEIEVPSPAPLGININNTFSTPVSCFGGSDGAAFVEAEGGTGGTGDYIYSWVNPPVSGSMIENVAPGPYVVNIEDQNGCKLAFTIEVGEPEPLVASIDVDNSLDVGCAGDEDGQISVGWTGGNPGNATYTWSPDVSDLSVATGLPIGNYSVTVTDEKGCTDEVSYAIGEPEPIVAIIPDPTPPVCNGDQTVVTIESATGGSSIVHWFSVDYGPQQFTNAAIPILAGQHTIQVFDSLDCFTEYTIDVPQPAPIYVDLGPNDTIQLGETLELDPTIFTNGVGIDTILWDPLDSLHCPLFEDDTLCLEAWVNPIETMIYELTVIDTNGCVGVDEIIVEVDKNRNVYIPNAFSPNGDGINDLFKIYTGVGVANINYIHIFDRWGEKLYSNEDIPPGDDFSLTGWDGRLKGKEMNNGVYIYISQIVFVDGTVLLYRGDVTLMR